MFISEEIDPAVLINRLGRRKNTLLKQRTALAFLLMPVSLKLLKEVLFSPIISNARNAVYVDSEQIGSLSQ
jgi:hypothetical protein